MSDDREYTVRQRAYELWEKDGKPPNKHLEYWLLAEAEMNTGPEQVEAASEMQPS